MAPTRIHMLDFNVVRHRKANHQIWSQRPPIVLLKVAVDHLYDGRMIDLANKMMCFVEYAIKVLLDHILSK